MMKRVVFLDLDGVLGNCESDGGIDPACVARLSELVARAGAGVVIASRWREMHRPNEMEVILESTGFVGRVVGEVPVILGHPRGDEIRAYLELVSDVDRFVVLDGNADLAAVAGHVVMVDDFLGLSDEDVVAAIDILDRCGSGGSVVVRPPTIERGMSADPDMASLVAGVRDIVSWWITRCGTMSVSMLEKEPLGQHLLNVANAQVKHGNVPDGNVPDVGKSRLERFLAFCGCDEVVVPRQQAHPLEPTLLSLQRRANSGLDCSREGLAADPEDIWRKRHQSLRKHRGGWYSVVRLLLERDDSLKPSCFYRRMSLGVWVAELSGSFEWWPPADRELDREAAIGLLLAVTLAYWERQGRGRGAMTVGAMQLHPDGSRLKPAINASLRRLNERRAADDDEFTYGDLVEQVTGQRYASVAASGCGAFFLRQEQHLQHVDWEARHERPHPMVRSWPEFAVDVVLGAVVGASWPSIHAHEVSLSALLGGKHKGYSVDLVLLDTAGIARGVIEVSAGDLPTRPGYKHRRAEKRQSCEAAGLVVVEVDLLGGRRTYHQLADLSVVVTQLLGTGEALTFEQVVNVIKDNQGTAVAQWSLDEVADYVSQYAEIQKGDDYVTHRAILVERGDLDGHLLPPYSTLRARLRASSMSFYDMTGRPPIGKGSGKARQHRPELRKYETYGACRTAAQRLAVSHGWRTCKDYQAGCMNADARLVYAPSATWRGEFERDGWPGYLGVGSSNEVLLGLVPSNAARNAVGLSYVRWQSLIEDLQPAGRRLRKRGRALFFDPLALATHLASRAVVEASEVVAVVSCFEALGRKTLSGRGCRR